MRNNIIVEGIETNNLKNIDIEIVKGTINLILGPSGSGKSTLAYDTIAQIGQYEYSSMFADDVSEPTYRVRSFNNMLPAVPIKQSNHNNNFHSTIGTYFGISRKIGLIYAAILGMEEDFFVLNKEGNVCEKCHGLGLVNSLDHNRIVNYNTQIKNIPFRCWNKYKEFYSQIICSYCDECEIDSNKCFKDLSEDEKQKLLYGISSKKYSVKYKKVGRLSSRTTKYYGVMLNHPMIPGYSIGKTFYSEFECSCCNGMKYNTEYLNYKVHDLSIGEFLTIDFEHLLPIIEMMIQEITDIQLRFAMSRVYGFVQKAVELKLGHLFFNRSIPTLSGGELQRLRLVQVFNTQLSNLLIVLDEPLAGLSRNEKPIIKRNVVELSKNNTVVVVDHGTAFLDVSKNTICLGESGGRNGGFVVDTDRYIKSQHTEIGFLAPKCDAIFALHTSIQVYQYTGADVEFALDRMNLITGDSGVGKTTLLREYFPQVIDDYLYINQKPMLGNKNSTVATALDIFTRISTIYGDRFNKDKKYFSNLTGNNGCCKKCGGAGYIEYGDNNSPLVRIECQECEGTGFNKDLKKYQIREKSIFEIWHMTIEEASEYYKGIDAKIFGMLCDAKAIMLGHLVLGQPTSTLSGGENIRIKMLKSIHSSAKVLGIDEPFKGLNNTEKTAVGVFLDSIRKKGKTIVVIDHSEDIEPFFSKHIIVKQVDNKIIGMKQ